MRKLEMVSKVYPEVVEVKGSDAAITHELDRVVDSLEVIPAGITLIADGSVVTAAAGDDIVVTGSLDGINFFGLGATHAAPATMALDEPIPVAITSAVKYLRFTSAQIQNTEEWKAHIVL